MSRWAKAGKFLYYRSGGIAKDGCRYIGVGACFAATGAALGTGVTYATRKKLAMGDTITTASLTAGGFVAGIGMIELQLSPVILMCSGIATGVATLNWRREEAKQEVINEVIEGERKRKDQVIEATLREFKRLYDEAKVLDEYS